MPIRSSSLFALISLGIFSLVFFVAPVSAQSSEGDIKDDISELEKKLKKEQKEADALKTDLQGITNSLSHTIKVIDVTADVIQKTSETIDRKESEIDLLERSVAQNRELLRELVREAYADASKGSLPEIFAEEDMFRALNNPEKLLSVTERMNGILGRIHAVQASIEAEKGSLEAMKAEKARLLAQKEREKNGLISEKVDTEGDLKEQLATISELQKKLRELQSDLNTITGKSFNAKDIREAVDFASGKTGVPKGVLYGFLKMETNLGANTGQCTYEQVEAGALKQYKALLKKNKKWQNSIDTLHRRQKLFYGIVDELGYNKNKKVSCNPRSYIGQGGAMGVPQFMSDTWLGYESQIASATGHRKPDPWNLTDGVMAMALKLKRAGANSDSASVIKSSSINYLGGFSKGYYDGIVYWSKNYARLFE